jgi:hypothetical protein
MTPDLKDFEHSVRVRSSMQDQTVIIIVFAIIGCFIV